MDIDQIFNMIALGGMVFLIFFSFLIERKLQRAGVDTKGVLPIPRPIFMLGKLSALACWLSILIQSAGGNLRYYFDFGSRIDPIAVTLIVVGIVIFLKGMSALGEGTSMGLPKSVGRLKTEGILQVTRNPIYLGNHIICIAAVIFTCNPIILFAALLSITIHHKIILAEEKFLLENFKDDYSNYMDKVRRYF
jgi:protein-S-isoprenylcysteine O-methyltransferase Ste14